MPLPLSLLNCNSLPPPLLRFLSHRLLLLLEIGLIEELGSKPRRLTAQLESLCRSKSNLYNRKFINESSREGAVVDPVEPEKVLKAVKALSSWLNFSFYLFCYWGNPNDNDFGSVFVWIFQIWLYFGEKIRIWFIFVFFRL